MNWLKWESPQHLLLHLSHPRSLQEHAIEAAKQVALGAPGKTEVVPCCLGRCDDVPIIGMLRSYFLLFICTEPQLNTASLRYLDLDFWPLELPFLNMLDQFVAEHLDSSYSFRPVLRTVPHPQLVSQAPPVFVTALRRGSNCCAHASEAEALWIKTLMPKGYPKIVG